MRAKAKAGKEDLPMMSLEAEPLDSEKMRQAMMANSFYGLSSLKLKITDRCNLRCPKCNHWRPKRERHPDRLTPLSDAEWMNLVSQAVALGVRNVRFSGGEPTLHPILPTLIEYLTRERAFCEVTTNGTCLSDSLAQVLVAAGMKRITFSVDYCESSPFDHAAGVHGAFANLEAGMHAVLGAVELGKRPVQVAVNTVVTRLNMKYLNAIYSWAVAHGASRITLLKVHESHLENSLGLSTDMENHYRSEVLPHLLEQGSAQGVEVIPAGYMITSIGKIDAIPSELLRVLPCFVAWERAAVFPSGEMYVCCHARNDLLKYGNVRQAPLDELLRRSDATRIRATCHAPALQVPECQDCDIDLINRLTLAKQLDLVK